jgi:hypothetical protein
MKCIKAIKQTKHYDLGEIRRTDDIDAEEKVSSGIWMYVQKSEWKMATRKPKEAVVVEVNDQITDSVTIAEKQLNRKKKSK